MCPHCVYLACAVRLSVQFNAWSSAVVVVAAVVCCSFLLLSWCKKRNRGVLIIRGEEVASCADRCKLTIRGTKMKNKDGMFGKSDPFFTLSRLREDEEWQQVCRHDP